MPKMDFFRRILLGCFTFTPTPTTSITTTTTTPTTKKRLSTSLREDIISDYHSFTAAAATTTATTSSSDDDTESTTTTTSTTTTHAHTPFTLAPPRTSNAKSTVICTFFGPRAGPHVWFSVQLNRLSPKPSLLLQLSLSTKNLVKEMQCGVLRIALECNQLEFSSYPLHSVPSWTMFCNGRPVGFATRRKPNSDIRELLMKMQSITVGAGVIHLDQNLKIINNNNNNNNNNDDEFDLNREGREFMYMRANYEWVIGGANSESFHLISPDDCSGQELSVFLLRSH